MASKTIKKNNRKSNSFKTRSIEQTKSYTPFYKKPLFFLFVIIAITIASYSNSINNDFANWDDDEQINKNADIKSLTTESIKKIFTSYYVGMYQPLTSLSFAIEYHFFGENPLPFHLNNLILHLANTILVYFFILSILRLKYSSAPRNKHYTYMNISAIIALIFGIHPMHVESVAWITERKDVLYSFFFICAGIIYISWLRKETFYKILLVYLFFILSLLSKSAAACFPLVLILIDRFINHKYNTKNIIFKIVFFATAIGFGYITIISQKSSGAIADLTPAYNYFERIFLASYAASFYIIKFFFPTQLCAMHYFPVKVNGMLPLEYYLSFFLIVAIITYTIFIRSPRLRNEVIFGLGFFLITIAMVLQIIPVGFAITAERYTYIPYIGLTFSVLAIILYYIENNPGSKNIFYKIFSIVLVAYTIFFSFATYSRNHVWENGIVLFSDVIQKNPESFHGYWIRGSAFSNKKEYSLAIADFDKALENKAPNAAEVLNNRGNAKNNINDFNGALQDLNEAVRINPKLAEAYSNRGSTKDNLGDFYSAMKDYDRALSLKPDMITAYNNRGVTKGKIAVEKGTDIYNDMAEAIKDFNKAISINPFDPSSYLNRGNAKGFLNDFIGSLQDFDIAVRLSPKEPQAYFNRAISKLNLKDTTGACRDWELAVKYGHKDAPTLINNYCR